MQYVFGKSDGHFIPDRSLGRLFELVSPRSSLDLLSVDVVPKANLFVANDKALDLTLHESGLDVGLDVALDLVLSIL